MFESGLHQQQLKRNRWGNPLKGWMSHS